MLRRHRRPSPYAFLNGRSPRLRLPDRAAAPARRRRRGGGPVRGRRAIDVGLQSTEAGTWEMATVALAGGRLLGRRRVREIVSWDQAAELFASLRGVGRQAAAIGQLHPVEMASALRSMPLEQ